MILPGTYSSTPVWEPNLKYLIKDRPVITLDLLGEPGLSEQTKVIASAEQQAQWASEVIQHVPFERMYLMGLSIGRWTAPNEVARDRTIKVEALMLLEPVFVFSSIPLKTVFASTAPIIPKTQREKILSDISGKELRGLEIPALGILADNSVMQTTEKSIKIGKENLKNQYSRMVVFTNASHAINGEYPEQLAEEIKQFLNTIEGE